MRIGRATLIHGDAFEWMRGRTPRSVHAIVTDPPYGLLEYSEREQSKLRRGRGGVWRIPPAFDGHRRAPLPRFTVLSAADMAALNDFFLEFGAAALRVTVPGAHVLVASNPLLVHVVANAMAAAGLQIRGYLARLVMTLRGESANLLSVGAIDFGLVVDATVIMMENIFRHLSEPSHQRFARDSRIRAAALSGLRGHPAVAAGRGPLLRDGATAQARDRR